MGWQPILLTGFLRDRLTQHFAEPLGVTNDLRKYVWRADERTGILIESVYRWRPEVTEKRPAVLVKRNAYQNQSVAIGDLSGEDEKSFGYEEFTTLKIGSHTLFCLHGTGASVEILATECERVIHRFSPVICRYLGLAKFQVTEVGGISEVVEAKEHYAVPITVGWAYPESWRLTYESLPLRRIPFEVLVDYAELDGS